MLTVIATIHSNNTTSQENENQIPFALVQQLYFIQDFEKFQPQR